MLYQKLNLHPGICAILGSGGKTSTMLALAKELPGRIIVCTTTHIKAPAQIPLYSGDNPSELDRLLTDHRVVCIGTQTAEQKLSASPIPMAELAKLADYVLVEADGSKRLPLKAHLPHEPVIPPEANRRLLLVGVSAFGKPVCDVAHRLERFCELAQLEPTAPVAPIHAARVILAENLCDTVLVNQVESDADLALAQELADILPQYPVYAIAAQKGRCQPLYPQK